MSKVRILFMGVVLSAVAHAAVVYTLDINLSPLHLGSDLSGSVTLANALSPGGTTPIDLSFSDPSDYTVSSLIMTLAVGNGTIGDTVRFSPVSFGSLNPARTINLMVFAPAQCAVDVPCQANGMWADNSPATFTGAYSVTTSYIPEPRYTMLMAVLSAGLFLGRRVLRRQ